MYTIRTGSGRDEPIETTVMTSDWEIGDNIFSRIEAQEIEPDGTDLPETLDMIEDTSEMEIEIYWRDEISGHAETEIDLMWEELTNLWEDEDKVDLYEACLKRWETRISGLST